MNNHLHHVLKFCVGFVAGLCAALFPRLIAELTISSENNVVTLFTQDYIVLSIVFAVLIGAVTTIIEWEDSGSPKDIFMKSLAIPGIISGALNTTLSVNDLEKAELDKADYQKIIEQKYNIGIMPQSILTPLKQATSSGVVGHQLSLFFISNAQANSGNFYRVSDLGIGIRNSQQYFLVVLDQARSREEAETKGTDLRSRIPVKITEISRNRFIITTNSGPQNKKNALLEAVRLKKEKGLNPSLMEIN